jgi:hypothetical protein
MLPIAKMFANTQRETVSILTGASENILRIDGEYFEFNSLDTWKGRANFIVFYYYAFSLYISLLLDVPTLARKAIENCHTYSEGATGDKIPPFTSDVRHPYFGLCLVLGSDFPTAYHERLDGDKFETVSRIVKLLRTERAVWKNHFPTQILFP